ncbi:MAG: hypothetical protein AAGH57_15300, partial [Pseudomonadota bacterium]
VGSFLMGEDAINVSSMEILANGGYMANQFDLHFDRLWGEFPRTTPEDFARMMKQKPTLKARYGEANQREPEPEAATTSTGKFSHKPANRAQRARKPSPSSKKS